MNNDNQHIPSGYKPSPLGIIPEDWEVKRLGEIAEITSGTTPSRNNSLFYSNGTIPWVKTTDLNNDVLNKTEELVTEAAVEQTSLRLLPTGTVLVAMYGGFNQIGRTALLGINATVNQALSALVCKQGVLNSYVLAWLNCKVGDWKRLAASSRKDPNITGKDVERFPILIPKMEEQQRIVSVLSLWDTAIAKQTALIEQLALRKRGLMQQLLTGKKRLKGFEGEWKEVRLGEIGVFFKGGGVPKDKITDTGNKCLTYGDLYTKYDFVISDVKSYIDDDTANESVKIRYGDICFAGSGETKEDIGKCAAFIDNEYGYAGGDIIVFRANDCNPITLSYILNSSDVIRQKSNMGQGHSVVHIYPYQLEKLLIKLPSRAEQDAIATILMESDKEIEIQKQKLTAMQAQKKGLMQVLLTGKKRIK
jgi:type I restriction enzyme S subunit